MKKIISSALTLLSLPSLTNGAVVQLGSGAYTPPMNTNSVSGQLTFQLLLNTPLNQNQGSEFGITFSQGSLILGRVQAPTSDVAGGAGGALKLTLGDIIGPATEWSASTSFSGSDWAPDGTIGYIGLRANPDKDLSTYYYGWRMMRWNADTTITLFDSAYESTPNQFITAGAVPEPSAIVLMMGGLAFTLRRYRCRMA